jgi:hypothetical protein
MVAFSILGGAHATSAASSPLLTFWAASFDRMPLRYTIVDLMSRWPSHDCTVRMSTPSRRWLVAKLVQEKVHAERSLGALVVVLGHALPAVEAGAIDDTLDDHIHLAVGFAAAVGEDQLIPRRPTGFLPADSLQWSSAFSRMCDALASTRSRKERRTTDGLSFFQATTSSTRTSSGCKR